MTDAIVAGPSRERRLSGDSVAFGSDDLAASSSSDYTIPYIFLCSEVIPNDVLTPSATLYFRS